MWRMSSLALLSLLASARADAAERPVDFRTDVIAALSHAGCNSGACHGSPQGKNGFRLSLRGHDADLDLFTLTRAERGRRESPSRPVWRWSWRPPTAPRWLPG